MSRADQRQKVCGLSTNTQTSPKNRPVQPQANYGLSRHLSCNLSAVQGLSLFSGLIRSTDVTGSLHMTWETSLAVESDIAQLRRAELNALSALLMRYPNRLYRSLLRSLQAQAFL